MLLFKQRKTKLYNGSTVKFGDKVSFVNSDKEIVVGTINRRAYSVLDQVTGKVLKKGTLFFLNIGYDIKDYKNLKLYCK